MRILPRFKKIPLNFMGTQKLKKHIVSMCPKGFECFHVSDLGCTTLRGRNISLVIRQIENEDLYLEIHIRASKDFYYIDGHLPRYVAKRVKKNPVGYYPS